MMDEEETVRITFAKLLVFFQALGLREFWASSHSTLKTTLSKEELARM